MFKEPRNRIQGIDSVSLGSLAGVQVRQIGLSYRPRQAKNRFLGSLKGLQIRAQEYQLSICTPETGVSVIRRLIPCIEIASQRKELAYIRSKI
jgi:hypothetical protein